MKIGVISDTHIPEYARRLPDAVFEIFRDCDLILHAGDAVEFGVIEELETLAPVKAVCGNMDRFRSQGLLPDKRIVNAGGCRIGLTHGWGAPAGIEDHVLRQFQGEEIHAVVFGHTHRALNEPRGGVLLFNPGSACGHVSGGFHSVGLLTAHGGAVSGQIIRLPEP